MSRLEQLGFTITSVQAKASSKLLDLRDDMTTVFDGIGQTINAHFAPVLVQLYERIIPALVSGFQSATPFIEAFATVFQRVANFVLDVAIPAFQRVANFLGGIGNIVRGLIGSTTNIVSDVAGLGNAGAGTAGADTAGTAGPAVTGSGLRKVTESLTVGLGDISRVQGGPLQSLLAGATSTGRTIQAEGRQVELFRSTAGDIFFKALKDEVGNPLDAYTIESKEALDKIESAISDTGGFNIFGDLVPIIEEKWIGAAEKLDRAGDGLMDSASRLSAAAGAFDTAVQAQAQALSRADEPLSATGIAGIGLLGARGTGRAHSQMTRHGAEAEARLRASDRFRVAEDIAQSFVGIDMGAEFGLSGLPDFRTTTGESAYSNQRRGALSAGQTVSGGSNPYAGFAINPQGREGIIAREEEAKDSIQRITAERNVQYDLSNQVVLTDVESLWQDIENTSNRHVRAMAMNLETSIEARWTNIRKTVREQPLETELDIVRIRKPSGSAIWDWVEDGIEYAEESGQWSRYAS